MVSLFTKMLHGIKQLIMQLTVNVNKKIKITGKFDRRIQAMSNALVRSIPC